MIGSIVRRALEHPEFRDQLARQPKETLDAHGFALEPEEMHEIERLSGEMSGDDVERKLASIAERYGIDPEVESSNTPSS